jgi:hypothetical protein
VRPKDMLDDGCFAGSVATDKPEDTSSRNLKRYIPKRLGFTKASAQVPDIDHKITHRRAILS